MSKFHTNIPVDVEASFAKLPMGSRVVNYTLDQAKRELVVEWEHDQLTTPYNVPIPFALDDLQAGNVPKMVKSTLDVRALPPTTEPAKIEQIAQPLSVKLSVDKGTVKPVKSRK